MPRAVLLVLFALLSYFAPICAAADWPMSRFNSQRTAASPEALPEELQLNWVREFPALRPAWPDQPKLQTDVAYDPVVSGKRMYLGSSRFDCVMALDTETGEEIWKFQLDGPTRFAPVVWEHNIYVACDDSFLYCLDADNGKLNWSFRGGPHDRRVLGNDRLISMWPARGAPVIADGKVYFAAGIWPFMGVFLHALDARTGNVIWTNSGDGALFIKQPHNAEAFAGIAPQGELVVSGNKLLIPGGRSIPAIYDRPTGKLSAYLLAENGKRGGGCEVAATNSLMINGGEAFDLNGERYAGAFGDLPVLMKDIWFAVRGPKCVALDGANAAVTQVETVDTKGAKTSLPKLQLKELTAIDLPGITNMIGAGNTLYVAQPDAVTAIHYDNETAKLKVGQKLDVPGIPTVLLAADHKLFAVSKEGKIYCFAKTAKSPKRPTANTVAAPATDLWTRKASDLLQQSKQRVGYCVVYGIGSGRLATELARQSALSVIVLDPDAVKVAQFREQLQATGLDRYRVAVHAGRPVDFPLPPYLANLIASEDISAAGIELNPEFVDDLFSALRPFGGTACLPIPANQREEFQHLVANRHLAGAKISVQGEMTLLHRTGALPESANWTHEHADAANTRVSRDKLVHAPLGILWFGGISHDGILPRHGHGPQPQVLDGRCIIEGMDMLRAIDIYTGRRLWQTSLPGLGSFYNNTAHQPGANASGTNFISVADGIYVAYGLKGLRLNPDTGEIMHEFRLPNYKGMEGHSNWGYLNVVDDYLIAGADPMFDPTQFKVAPENYTDDDPVTTAKELVDKANTAISAVKDRVTSPGKAFKKIDSDNLSSSRHLVVLDRHSGKVLWSITSENGFRHNGTCAGNGRLYTVDRISGLELAKLKRRGETSSSKARLLVHDLKTGNLLWSTEKDVFGTWLSYSQEFDLLVEAGRLTRDAISDEPKGMRVYRASTGEVVWENMNLAGPSMLHHEWILMAGATSGNACELLTGKLRKRQDPLTSETTDWSWLRTYGCNTPMASENLLTFRSGAAGYFDLCNDGGTGNLGGFRSSCSNNLVVAGGVLVAPDYTRTCTCNYQIQTSLALVHMPEAEMWTYTATSDPKAPVRQVGINFGAAGDRKADNGTLWLEYPSTGGKSATVPVAIKASGLQWYRQHSSSVAGDGLPWVVASGGKGIQQVVMTLAKKAEKARSYTVRLYFLEPDNVQPEERVFDISLQGQVKMQALDVVRESCGRGHGLVKEFKGVSVTDELKIDLTPAAGSKLSAPLLSGVEAVIETNSAE